MNRILKETHKKENIQLLKIRDYYFDIARRYNRLKILFMWLPPVLLTATYFPILSGISWIANGRDYIVGFVSIAAFLLIHFHFEKKISDNLYISNAFREKYDCNVFGIDENPFAYKLESMPQHMDKARFINDFYKYEVWYGETFCDKNGRNVICCQMDNIIYTYYVYKDYKRLLIAVPVVVLPVLLMSILYGFNTFILVFISAFNILQLYIESIGSVNELIETNQNIMEIVRSSKDEIIEKLNKDDDSVIRMLQDIVLNNRNRSLFIPKYIRTRHLREDSVYYLALNDYKDMFLEKESVAFPSSAEELEIFSLNESNTVTLHDIQQRLLYMMEKVCQVFMEENITYTLDGGTLIGAVRSSDLRNPIDQVHIVGGKFVFWDDDIDIAIPTMDGMLERAKDVLRDRLGDEFDIQEYRNDLYYSPRLSNFRIRDRKSIISEKDSPLYDKYRYRGLFIDVYAYSPILHSFFLDKIYRCLFIHPLYKKLKKIEDMYPRYNGSGKQDDKQALDRLLKKFEQQKEKYMRHVDWYGKHAQNDDYLVYMPNYIHQLKHPGPYIKKTDLYGDPTRAQFHLLNMPIPSASDKVLKAFYGKWYISPYKSKDMLIDEYGKGWYSHNDFLVSVMKHIDHVDVQKKTNKY